MFGATRYTFRRAAVNCVTEPGGGANALRLVGSNGWSALNVHVPFDLRIDCRIGRLCAPAPNFHACLPVVIDTSSRICRESRSPYWLVFAPHARLGKLKICVRFAVRRGSSVSNGLSGVTPGTCARNR